ncbi:anti-sigma factor family protein [Dictyobacter aurantiacus]|uniref:Putative zinc-finger domain-containing protein n=1 Tax=Dictyobacter aurantiacus TaxID=1936993 RepID=A0A401ZHM2_9CHLR|nr:zf-HC2 domain-containing protein [Dictyobacter aurantiacus]GCE06367.1 hypothetical protein KDAU_36960 [Dictyobacter aurantiacus]
MNCEQVRDLLSAYLDDQLTANERQYVDTHLTSCPHCAGVLADYRRFDTLLAQLPRVTPTTDLRDRILAAAGPFTSDGKKQAPDSSSNWLQYTPLSLPIRNVFPQQQSGDNSIQAPSKSSSSFSFQPLLNHYPRRNLLGLQIAIILLLILLTNGIRLLLLRYNWPRHS